MYRPCVVFRHLLVVIVLLAGLPFVTGVDLQQHRITQEYRYQLTTAIRALAIWLSVRSLPSVTQLVKDEENLIRHVTDYIQYLYDSGASLSSARHTVLALQTFHRKLKGRLVVLWDSVRSWELLRPCSMRVPVPFLVVEAIFAHSMATGFRLQGQKGRGWLCFGVAVLCMFSGLLRPGEVAGLGPGHISLPGSGLHGVVDKAVVCLAAPKTKRSLGRQQVATISDPRAISWLAWLVEGMEVGSAVFQGGTMALRRHMAACTEALGLSGSGFTPGGLRAGGTTFLFVGGAEVARIRVLGRWKVMETLDHYIQEASAALALIRLPADILATLQRLKAAAPRFGVPPEFPWECYFHRERQSKQWITRLLRLRQRRQRS